MLADPKSAKKTDKLTVLYVLLESSSVKAAHKMLMKLTPVRIKKTALYIRLCKLKSFFFQTLQNIGLRKK